MPKKLIKRRNLRGNSLRQPNALLDECNLAILSQLTAEPRVPMRELARRVGMSAPAVTERILRLREAGIIKREWLEIDPQAMGFSVLAFVRVRPMPGSLPRIAELARRTPEVLECHRVTGEDCFIMKMAATNIAALEALLDKFLLHGTTTSSLVVSSPVAPRALPLRGYEAKARSSGFETS